MKLFMMFLSFLFVLLLAVDAAPLVSFPINAQVPPVARIGSIFDFSFCASTFTSLASNVSYSLGGAPEWLTLDSEERRFVGTPGQGDGGSPVFDLIATDSSGSASASVTFVVVNTVGPQLAPFSAAAVVTTVGSLSGSGSVLLSPGSTIGIDVNSSIFINTDASTQYYAICGDNTPLPSWLAFDPSDLSFSGITPAASSPLQLPEIYDVHVIATDVPGFSSAVFQLRLTIDSNSTEVSTPLLGAEIPSLNLTCGETVSFTIPAEAFAVDDVETSANLGNCSSWLFYNPQNLTFTGKVPDRWLPQVYHVNLTVSKSSQSDWEEISITVNKQPVEPTSAPTVSVSPSAPTSTSSNTTDGTTHASSLKGPIAISAVVLLVVAILGGFIWWWKIRKAAPIVLPNPEPQTPRGIDRLSQYLLRSPSDNPFDFGEPPSSGTSQNSSRRGSRQSFRDSFTKNPISTALSAAQKIASRKRRAAPLGSRGNIGLGHGGIPLRGVSTAPRTTPRHIAIQIPLVNTDSEQPAASANDSYEIVNSLGEPVQPSSPLDDSEPMNPQSNRTVQRSKYPSNPLTTIRPVPKSPTPSEMPSPELPSSPRAKLQSYVHDRATGHKPSALFSSASTQRTTEQEMAAPSQASRRISTTPTALRLSPDLQASYFDRKKARDSATSLALRRFPVKPRSPSSSSPEAAPKPFTNTKGEDDPFYTSPSASKTVTKPETAKVSAERSPNNSLYTDDSAWVDEAEQNATPAPLVWHTGSSQALSYLASPTIVDPARNARTATPSRVANNATANSPLEYGSTPRPARVHAPPRQRPLSIEEAAAILEQDNLSHKSPRGDSAFP